MMEQEKEEIINKIEGIKADYYTANTKNMFFKNSQKLQVAQHISNQINVELLLDKTVYSINGSPNIYLDYTIFKLYANETNYDMIITYICGLVERVIATHGYFSFYTNFDGFTITAAERYRPCVELFVNNYYTASVIKYTDYMQSWTLLNPPSIMDIIMKLFKKIIDERVAQRLIVVPKNQSAEVIRQLHSSVM